MNRFPSSSAPPLATFENVSLRFGGIHALRGVSFAVEEGSIHSIIGPNGAGKTTLLNCVSGSYRPGGRILYQGTDLIPRPPHARTSMGIARVFQNIALFEEETVLDNLLVGGHSRLKAGMFRGLLYWTRFGCQAEERSLREEALATLAELGMEAERDALVRDLPYGRQKRVEFARALMAKPRLALLDEPMAGMNAAEKRELADHIRRMNRDRGVTVLMIEHDVGMVRNLSDRVVVLDFGKKIAEGTPAEALDDPAVQKAYLGEEEEA